MKRIALAVALLGIALGVVAQGSFFSEVMEVRVTNVEVVVTSKDGKPVKGLTRDDFELYEDGVKKEISNFLEVQEESVATQLTPAVAEAVDTTAIDPGRRKSIVVFFDNAALQPARRRPIVAELQKFIRSNVRPGDEVAIMTWEHSLKAELEPTTDLLELEAALKRIEETTAVGNRLTLERREFEKRIMTMIAAYADADRRGSTPGKAPFGEALGFARAHAMSLSNQARQRVEALKAVAASMRGVSGRKVLVFVTESFTSNPAEGAFAFLDSMRDSFAGSEGQMAMDSARDFEIENLVKDIADVANSAGVTLYPIDGAGKEAGMSTVDASQNTVIASRAIPISQTGANTMNGIAAETGGVALYGSTNWQLAFQTIASDLNSYYSLGYRSSGERQDQLKKITVKLKNKRYTARARTAVIEPSVSSEMNDAVASHLFREVRNNDLSVRAIAGTKSAGDGQEALVPLTIIIPTEKLTLLPDGSDLTGSFSIFAAFLLNDGRVSEVARQPQAFRFPADSLKRRKEITVKVDVKTDPTTSGISVGVMDEASRATGFATVKLGG